MPCVNDYYGCDHSHMEREIDKLTRMLCEVLQRPGVISMELREWWEKHQKADARRKAYEQSEKDKEAKRQAALSKLTAVERKLLGL